MTVQDVLIKWHRMYVERVMNAEFNTETIVNLLQTMSDWELARPVELWLGSSAVPQVAIVPVRTPEESQIAEWGILVPVPTTLSNVQPFYLRAARQAIRQATEYALESGLVARDLEAR